jgi:hypothetical protein
MELILGEVEVWSRQARVTVCKSHNFCSDCWMSIESLQKFQEAIFQIVDVE